MKALIILEECYLNTKKKNPKNPNELICVVTSNPAAPLLKKISTVCGSEPFEMCPLHSTSKSQ